MPIDLAAVNWLYVGILAVFVFVSAGLGNLLSLNSRGTAAVLSAVIFAVIFVVWTHYPHGLPLPIAPTEPIVREAQPAAPAPASEQPPRPANPVRDITPDPNAPR